MQLNNKNNMVDGMLERERDTHLTVRSSTARRGLNTSEITKHRNSYAITRRRRRATTSSNVERSRVTWVPTATYNAEQCLTILPSLETV